MRNANRHNQSDRSWNRSLEQVSALPIASSAGPRFWRRLALVVALGWRASNLHDHSAPSAGNRLSAQDKRRAAAPEVAAYCFDVPLPITDAVEKSVTRRVERAIRQLAPE